VMARERTDMATMASMSVNPLFTFDVFFDIAL
jgi:hypothetical protein